MTGDEDGQIIGFFVTIFTDNLVTFIAVFMLRHSESTKEIRQLYSAITLHYIAVAYVYINTAITYWYDGSNHRRVLGLSLRSGRVVGFTDEVASCTNAVHVVCMS